MTGYVYKAERFCIHDGPGIRTLFYLRGCPLSCRWCSNPESQPMGSWDIPGAEGLLTWREPVPVEDLVDIAVRDLVYYRYSGGGVTLTGGEVLAQPEFAAALLAALKAKGIHTAIETSGYAPEASLRLLLPHTDLVLYDLKHMDETAHRQLTGHSNRRVLENALAVHDSGVPMLLRYPMIPGLNDSEENLRTMGRFARSRLPEALGLCVLPYHSYGRSKYRQMGLEYPLDGLPQPNDEQTARAAALLRQYIGQVQVGG